MTKVQLNADGKQWDIVNGSQVETFNTIKEATDRKFELSREPAAKVLYFKQDGSPVTKQPRQRAA